jgi:ABC-type multidrug transport system ATPase subunit
MTLAENVALPLEQYTSLAPGEISDLVSLKLSLVGLAGFEEFYPSEISGGMCKRAGLARAMALDPDILFFDEPSAGLDPISSKLLDDLILELRASLGATVVVVTHELASIFAIGDNSVFDGQSKAMIASGNPERSWPNRRTRGARFPHRGGAAVRRQSSDAHRSARPGAVALAVLGRRLRLREALSEAIHLRDVLLGSITGLSVGSPVEFRGARSGVTKIAAVPIRAVTVHIPVYRVDPKSLIVVGDEDA